MDKHSFLLEVVTFTKKRRKHKEDYQPFTTDVSFVSLYERHEDAEVGIRQFLDEYGAWDIYCFYIHQVPFGCFLYPHNLDSYAAWLYDARGNLIDERPYPTYRFGQYFSGRPKEKLRFHFGDIVEYNGDLCIIISVPREHYDRMMDDSDDSYCVFYLDEDFGAEGNEFSHAHPNCLDVMPLRFPISRKVQEQINRVKEQYVEYQKRK
ncbi:MAG: hypothetical protein UEP29_14835 [Phocaeicola massiliensis]|nr:hypothetical protein [Phocaeicola massiliensis]